MGKDDGQGRRKVFGDYHDPGTLHQFHEIGKTARWAALMADGHHGYAMPVGGVCAWEEEVSIEGVGVDIGCGNMAVKTSLSLEDFEAEDVEALADEIHERIAFGPGRNNTEPDAPGMPKNWTPQVEAIFTDPSWDSLRDLMGKAWTDSLRDTAMNQLGTIGGGNHYVDVLVGEDGHLWVGVHFGSRGFGYTLSNLFLSISQGKAPTSRPTWGKGGTVHLDNPVGQDYWHAMELAGRYAFIGREWVVNKVVEIMGHGVQVWDEVHNHHNYAWHETHHGENLVVVRKGATPAWPDQRGFVGGSMGDDAVILRGAEHEVGSREHWIQRQALYSTVHGAGRPFSRGEAKRTLDREEWKTWLDDVGVTLRGGGLDESPMAYRRLDDVLEAMGDTVEVEERLRPLIVCMAS